MALITCPECKNNVSDMAPTCPYCGYPILQYTESLNGMSNSNTSNYNGGMNNGTYPNYSNSSAQGANAIYNDPNYVGSTSYTTSTISANPKPVQDSKPSALSIWAFILSLLGCTSLIGLIFAIVDLSKKDGRKKGLSIAALVIQGILFLIGFLYGIASPFISKNQQTTPTNTVTTTPTQITSEVSLGTTWDTPSDTPQPEEIQPVYNITVASDTENMSVGEIGEKKDIYVGLSYVKRMSSLPDALGGTNEVSSPNNEVIVGFFEFFNGSGKKVSVNPDDITCYVDGTQVKDVESYTNILVDDVRQFYSTELEPDTKLISCQDFEVPKDWKEIKFFYESTCVWVVHPEDVKTEAFEMKPMFDNYITMDETQPGTIIYDSEYQLTYEGNEYYTYHNQVWGDYHYIVFKYNINNTSDEAIDCSLVGYKMRAYQDGYALEDATYTLDDKIDGFINIFDIDSIEKGMSSDIYIAFPVVKQEGDLYMVFDDGYIVGDTKGCVYIGATDE